MKFRTEVEVPSFPFTLNHKNKIMLMGSCFTQNIGNKLTDSGFETFSNPYGITFNPLSLCQQLEELISLKKYIQEDLTYFNNQYLSLQHHSVFTKTSTEESLEKINSEIKKGNKFLKEADVLFISLGTAWVWKKAINKTVVNNCHKIPAKEFSQELLSSQEIEANLEECLNLLQTFSPDLKVIFTISPVRHWRHGAVDNQRSKSILLNAVHQTIDNSTNGYYFPSYEIMMDDLRDYRFYADDLIHLSSKAIEYIWKKFKSGFFNTKTIDAIDLINKITSMRNHRSITQINESDNKFNAKLALRIDELKSKHGIEFKSK